MAQVLKSSGIVVSKAPDGQLLLSVYFRNLGDEKTPYSWMPQWGTVRDLMLAAMIIEGINKPGGEEVKEFEACLSRCHEGEHTLHELFFGQFGVEV